MELALAKGMLKDFKAFQFAKLYFHRCKGLRVSATFKDQILRASSSIALNLAESGSRASAKDRVRFYSMALGSLRECQAILELEGIEDVELTDIGDQLGAILHKLCGLPRRGEAAKATTEAENT